MEVTGLVRKKLEFAGKSWHPAEAFIITPTGSCAPQSQNLMLLIRF